MQPFPQESHDSDAQPRPAEGSPLARRAVMLVYELGLMAFFALSLPYFLWKGRGTGKYLATFRERMGRLPRANAAGERSIWIHAVSVGEVLAARPLARRAAARFPELRLFVSTTTLTGHAVARQRAAAPTALFFAPFDFRRPVRADARRAGPGRCWCSSRPRSGRT